MNRLQMLVCEMVAEELRVDLYGSLEAAGLEPGDLYRHETVRRLVLYRQTSEGGADKYNDLRLAQFEARAGGATYVEVPVAFDLFFAEAVKYRIRCEAGERAGSIVRRLEPSQARSFALVLTELCRAGVVREKYG